jgi:hypothetical protein
MKGRIRRGEPLPALLITPRVSLTTPIVLLADVTFHDSRFSILSSVLGLLRRLLAKTFGVGEGGSLITGSATSSRAYG